MFQISRRVDDFGVWGQRRNEQELNRFANGGQNNEREETSARPGTPPNEALSKVAQMLGDCQLSLTHEHSRGADAKMKKRRRNGKGKESKTARRKPRRVNVTVTPQGQKELYSPRNATKMTKVRLVEMNIGRR